MLDLRTIYFTTAIVSLLLGALQMSAFAFRRSESWLAWWAFSSLFAGGGVLLTAIVAGSRHVGLVHLANLLTIGGYLSLLASVRLFSAGRAEWRSYLLVGLATAMASAILWWEPVHFAARVAIISLLCAGCDVAIAWEGWRLYRRERLSTARILTGLFGLTAIAFVVRAGMAVQGALGGDLFAANEGPHLWMVLAAASVIALRGIVLLVIAAERRHNDWERLALHDALTGAVNRAGLQAALDRLVRSPERRGANGLTLLLIDIDHFKKVNDTQGHAAGDEVLRLLASVAREQLRGTDVLARQGGDEFVVLLPGAGIDQGMAVAERIRLAFARAARRPDVGVHPTLSIGVTETNGAGTSLDALLAEADRALYASKRRGRNAVERFQPVALAA